MRLISRKPMQHFVASIKTQELYESKRNNANRKQVAAIGAASLTGTPLKNMKFFIVLQLFRVFFNYFFYYFTLVEQYVELITACHISCSTTIPIGLQLASEKGTWFLPQLQFSTVLIVFARPLRHLTVE